MPRTKLRDLDQLAPVMLPDVPRGAAAPPVVWRDLFGHERPVEIEVGFGKGMFLLAESERRPDVDFLGIEIDRRLQITTAHRLREAGRTNVRVAWADAKGVLSDRVAPGSVDAVHVYFPDPWWKSKHRKRRVFTPEFASLVGRVLRVGGRLHIATDVEAYHEIMTRIVRDLGDAFAELPVEPLSGDRPLTHFERKFREQGRPIFRASYARTAAELPERLQRDPGLAGPFDEFQAGSIGTGRERPA